MSAIDRRTALTAITAALAGTACSSKVAASQVAPAPKQNPVTTAADEDEENRPLLSTVSRIGKPGILIRLEGLIAYAVTLERDVCTGIEAMMMRGPSVDHKGHKMNRKDGHHRHVPTIAIPRRMFTANVEPDAADSNYAYFTLKGTLSISSPTPKMQHIDFSLATPAAPEPSTDDEWKSTGWIMDLEDAYRSASGERRTTHRQTEYSAPAVVRFGAGAEFEPRDIRYARRDLPNGVWEMHAGEGNKRIDGRTYKHSIHAFYEGQSVDITGKLSDGKPMRLTVAPGSVYPVAIYNVPVIEQKVGDVEGNRHVTVYAELLKRVIAGARDRSIEANERLYPHYVRNGQRHETCGCCQNVRFVKK